jgi:RNA polymerase sigma-70 factor (ECF subfamily)
MNVSDDDLIAEAVQHPQAYGALVDRYQVRVYNLMYRMVGNSQDAEDLAQEAFWRFYRSLARFQPGAPVYPYLHRIAANLCLSHLKARRPEAEPLPDADLVPSREGRPEVESQRRERVLALGRAIQSLPPQLRAALLLRHLDGLSYEEIAEAMAAPVGSVKTWLFRARQALLERLSVSEALR